MARRYKWRIETYVYHHNQAEGIVARRVWVRDGTVVEDRSKYFSESKFGSLSTAEWHARRWKNANLLGPSNRNRDGRRASKGGR
jgi:hypothetical protein